VKAMAQSDAGLAAIQPTEQDIQMLLASEVHLGTKNCSTRMLQYVWKRRNDGFHIINLAHTWDKLMLAARIITAIENPADVVVISSRPAGQRAVYKFAQFTGTQCIAGRFTPGTFTNQIQKKHFKEPRLLVVSDPFVDSQPVREASYVNVPVIAFCNCDSPLDFIDVAIPANNQNKNAVALLWWLLGREVLRMRNTVNRKVPWDVSVDLFIFREPEEVEAQEREKKAHQAIAQAAAAQPEALAAVPASFENEAPPSGEWGAEGEAPAEPTFG